MTANTAKTAKAAAQTFACRCSLVRTASGETTGCAELTVSKFKPGHDAKLKSLLGLAQANGEMVTVTTPGTNEGDANTETEMSPLEAAGKFGNFGYMVTEIAAKLVAKRERAANHKAKLAASKAQREAKKAEKGPKTTPAKAKVGRWEYEGFLVQQKSGDVFRYTNKKDETVEVAKFQLV